MGGNDFRHGVRYSLAAIRRYCRGMIEAGSEDDTETGVDVGMRLVMGEVSRLLAEIEGKADE